jgi:mercuric ion transport protein
MVTVCHWRTAGNMTAKRNFKLSLGASVVAAVCCFTPLLGWLLGLMGVAHLTGWIDYVALPVLGVSLALTLIFFFKMRSE